MEKFLNGVVDNYVWFLVISILLIFALIGFFVDIKKKKANPYKIENKEEINLENIQIKEDVALSEMVNKNKDVGIENTPMNMDTLETLDNNQNNTQV